MAINLITGQPRNGKSQRMMALVLELVKKNDSLEKQGQERRPIYIDIDGVNGHDTKTKIDDCITEFERDKIWFGEHDDTNNSDDYWCPPYGSIFVFDECHKREWVKDSSGSVSKNPTTISLNEHGHAGHDIYLLTQFPQYVHTHIRGLIQEHWHVKRIMNSRTAKVYKWTDFISNPRTEKAFQDAYEVEIFNFRKKYQDTYKSASAHSPIKFTFPKKLILPLVALFLIACALIYFGRDSIFAKKLKEQEIEQAVQQQRIDDLSNLNQEQNRQIQQMRLELEQLKQQYLPKHIATLAAYEDVRPAMIISNERGCMSYNSYGEPLLLTDSLCQQMSDHPSMIPRTRQVKTQVEQPKNTDIFGNEDVGANIKYFDHSKNFN